jgi:hypothetical protein
VEGFDLQGPVLVRPDGTFTIPCWRNRCTRQERGRTAEEYQRTTGEVHRRSSGDGVDSEVRGNKIYVIGQVTKPGEFVVNPQVNGCRH